MLVLEVSPGTDAVDLLPFDGEDSHDNESSKNFVRDRSIRKEFLEWVHEMRQAGCLKLVVVAEQSTNQVISWLQL